MSVMKTDHLVAKRRPRPNCEHKGLSECPLTPEDWAEIHRAWLAFKFQCVLISDRAHKRAERKAS